MRVLFVCSRNRLRSPTAEQLFRDWPGIEVDSAGLKGDAEQVLDAELLAWAELIVVMEKQHRRELARRFSQHLRDKRIVCLDIRDDYDFMAPALVALLQERVPPLLR